MNAWLRGIPSLVDTAEAELVVKVLQRAAVQFCRERVSTEMPVLDGEEGRTVWMCLGQDALHVCKFFFSETQASGPAMEVPRDLLCGGVKDGCFLDGGTYKLP